MATGSLTSPRKLQRAVSHLLKIQSQAVLDRLTGSLLTGSKDFDLEYLVKPSTQAIGDVLQPYYLQGVKRVQERLRKRGLKVRTKGAYSPILKARPKIGVNLSFDVVNPRIKEGVNLAVLHFCRTTLDTLTLDLNEALKKLRKLLREGLTKAEAQRTLAEKVRKIFNDPIRAFRIAVTESSRALHAGQLIAAEESGVVKAKKWLASSDACDNCLELDGIEKALDEPFIILPGGGPYAKVMAPPLHPHCFCDMTEVV